KQRNEKSGERSQKTFFSEFENTFFAATPDSNRNLWPEVFAEYVKYMKANNYRVMLSGLAGENPTGGFVPSPQLELQDLLAGARFLKLIRQLNAWAAKMGTSPIDLFLEALQGFFSHSLVFPGAPSKVCPPPWLCRRFVRRNQAAFRWYPSKIKLFGGLPSFQYQLHLLNFERRLMAYLELSPELVREIRYPFLDRDLLEFACAVPREQT